MGTNNHISQQNISLFMTFTWVTNHSPVFMVQWDTPFKVSLKVMKLQSTSAVVALKVQKDLYWLPEMPFLYFTLYFPDNRTFDFSHGIYSLKGKTLNCTGTRWQHSLFSKRQHRCVCSQDSCSLQWKEGQTSPGDQFSVNHLLFALYTVLKSKQQTQWNQNGYRKIK